MFIKLAQFLLAGVGCARQTRATPGYRAGSQADCHLAANSRRARRPTLICGWRKAPSSGALECHWQAIDLPEADELAQWRHGRTTRSPTGACAGKRPFTRAAA
jgi:hypothetical protein